MRNWKSLAVFLLIVFAAAVTGAMSSPDGWFKALNKPWFNPPTWVFPPAWTILYFLMAFAAWRVYLVAGIGAGLVVWGIQLIANAAWTPLFFGLHRIDLALIDVAILWLLVLTTTILFFQRSRAAGYMLIPYLAWVSFAMTLTFAIWRLNPD
ncbi:MAG: TspO/MBR family protein [Rudaea sp.]